MTRLELRRKLILEALLDTLEGLGLKITDIEKATITLVEPNMIEAIDGMCDLIYVTIGTAIEFGIDLQPFFDEVHRSNMAKAGGSKDASGKTLKPPGWTPPNIVGELTHQIEREIVKVRAKTQDEPLTDREREIMMLLIQGIPNQMIAKKLKISVKTVDTHRGKILKKTCCANNVTLVHWAARNGYLAL